MKLRGKNIALVLAGVLIGCAISGPTVSAATEIIKAYRSSHPIYVDGKSVELEAYVINGNNYVKLRDVGEAVGFNVYWDGHAAQVESSRHYTGEPPVGDDAGLTYTDNLEIRYEVAALINELRRENGLNELVIDNALMDAAQERAIVCAETHSLVHNKELSTSILQKYHYGNGGAACNIGWSSNPVQTADEIVAMFKNSPGHYETMLLDMVEDVGVGIYYDHGIYMIMYLGNKEAY